MSGTRRGRNRKDGSHAVTSSNLVGQCAGTPAVPASSSRASGLHATAGPAVENVLVSLTVALFKELGVSTLKLFHYLRCAWLIA